MLLNSVIVTNTWLARSRRPLLSTLLRSYSVSAELSTPTHPLIDTDSDDFLSWLEHKSGTEISSALAMGKSSYGRTLCAAEDIQAGDCILKVPYSSQLSLDNLPLEINSLLGDGVGNVAKLALLVLHEKKLGKSSEWAPYISLLPHPVDLNSTIFWSDQELGLIKPCALYEETMRQKAQIEKDFLRVQLNFQDFTLQEFSYAYGLVTSRAWESSRGVYMIPFVDLFNHDGTSEAYVLSDESNRHSEVIADRDFVLGDEVFITYGKFSNATLLLDFGFTVSCNEYDQARVQLNVPHHDGLYEQKLKLLDSHRTLSVKNDNDFTCLGNSFQIRKVKKGSRKGKGIPQSLRAFCRVITCDSQQELDAFSMEALENDGRLARFPLKDKIREIVAHEYLLAEISRLIKEYNQCMKLLVSGPEGLSEQSVVRRRLAQDLLTGEVRVLESAAEWLENYCSGLLTYR